MKERTIVRWSMAPNVVCSCGKFFALASDFEEGPGSKWVCPHCGRLLECDEEETYRHWGWKEVPSRAAARECDCDECGGTGYIDEEIVPVRLCTNPEHWEEGEK